VLSGHTHGGQVRFLSGLGPPHPGLRVRLGPTTLIVNRGLGVVGFPWRVGAPTEIVLVRLEPG
jgi:predicted MPP superfamily phosphohydrolase